MNRPEDQLQVTIVDGLRAALPPFWVVHHSPNAGKRSVVAGRVLRRLGMVKGWPDLMIVGDVTADPGLWFLELKTGGLTPDADQRALHERLRHLGFGVAVVRSWEDVLTACRHWGIPLRLAGLAA